MCVNFELAADPVFHNEAFIFEGVNLWEKFKQNITAKDIRPTNSIIIIRKRKEEFLIEPASWGIKFSDKSPLIYNSRMETIKEKPFWKNTFNKNRGLLPMSGFFEWQKIGKSKIKKKVFLPDNNIFFVPALFIEMNGTLFTSLVTVPPNEFIKPIHHRMPAIILKNDKEKLLNADIDEAINMCEPYKGEMNLADVKLKSDRLF